MRKIDTIQVLGKPITEYVRIQIIMVMCPSHFGLNSPAICDFDCEKCWNGEVEE